MLTKDLTIRSRNFFFLIKYHETTFKTTVYGLKLELKMMKYHKNIKILIKHIISFQVKMHFLGLFHAINYTNTTTTGANDLGRIKI